MQDFELNEGKINSDFADHAENAEKKQGEIYDNKPEDGELTMTVSPVCLVDGQKKAFVNFTDGKRNAEGEIPGCMINKSEGFTEEEKSQLEDYMRANLTMLKKMAANIDVLAAMMKSE